MDAAVSRGQDGPSYGLALVAVLAAGAVASAVSVLFIGLFAVGGMPVRYLVGALISALVVQVILRVLGFEISYGGAFGAMLPARSPRSRSGWLFRSRRDCRRWCRSWGRSAACRACS